MKQKTKVVYALCFPLQNCKLCKDLRGNSCWGPKWITFHRDLGAEINSDQAHRDRTEWLKTRNNTHFLVSNKSPCFCDQIMKLPLVFARGLSVQNQPFSPLFISVTFDGKISITRFISRPRPPVCYNVIFSIIQRLSWIHNLGF